MGARAVKSNTPLFLRPVQGKEVESNALYQQNILQTKRKVRRGMQQQVEIAAARKTRESPIMV